MEDTENGRGEVVLCDILIGSSATEYFGAKPLTTVKCLYRCKTLMDYSGGFFLWCAQHGRTLVGASPTVS